MENNKDTLICYVNIRRFKGSNDIELSKLHFGQYFERYNINRVITNGLYLKLDAHSSSQYRCYYFDNNLLVYIDNNEVVSAINKIKIEYNADI